MASLLRAGLSHTKYLIPRSCLAVKLRVLHWGQKRRSQILTIVGQLLAKTRRTSKAQVTLWHNEALCHVSVTNRLVLSHIVLKETNSADMRNWNLTQDYEQPFTDKRIQLLHLIWILAFSAFAVDTCFFCISAELGCLCSRNLWICDLECNK